MRADGIISGRTAENAGVKAGDIIIQIGDAKVNNLQEYMKVLLGFKKDDVSTVTILRDGKEIKLSVTF